MKNKICKTLVLFLIGGSIYTVIETVWRFFRGSNPTHWSMFILGGLCFVLLGAINEYLSWDTALPIQALIGTVIVLSLEFIFGFIFNVLLGLGIWDYSHMPFNIMGQICLPFALAWFVLSIIAIILDDWLRYWLFNEEKPHYRWI